MESRLFFLWTFIINNSQFLNHHRYLGRFIYYLQPWTVVVTIIGSQQLTKGGQQLTRLIDYINCGAFVLLRLLFIPSDSFSTISSTMTLGLSKILISYLYSFSHLIFCYIILIDVTFLEKPVNLLWNFMELFYITYWRKHIIGVIDKVVKFIAYILWSFYVFTFQLHSKESVVMIETFLYWQFLTFFTPGNFFRPF